MKTLHVALERQDYTLAAHILVYGLIKTKCQDAERKNGEKERRPARQPKR